MFVKLQRPPPEISIFLPTRGLCSMTSVLRFRFPVSIAQKRPAAPPPMIMTSHMMRLATHRPLYSAVRYEPHHCDGGVAHARNPRSNKCKWDADHIDHHRNLTFEVFANCIRQN